MIRVAYLDLGISKEQYGLSPTRYGGGGVVARYLKEDLEVDFHVFAPPEAYDNVGRHEAIHRCHVWPEGLADTLKRGAPLQRGWFEVAMGGVPDIVLHPHTCETINRGNVSCPIAHFCGFDGAAGHPGNDYVLFYDDTFIPRFGEKPKYVRIGKPVPETYTPHPKAPYVFQCSRHDDHMNGLETARQCRRYGIKGYFAGPIHNGYSLMEEIDGRITHYLGEIDEATKLAYCRHARLFALPHQWDVPFSQSIVEAQGEGTPIWATKRGPFLTRYLEEGVNGYDAATVSLLQAFNAAEYIDHQACWRAARAYDVSVMVSTFKRAFREIVAECVAR